MQKEINDEIWENKDIRSARMNAVNGARDLVAAFTNAGFYKTKEEAFDDFHAFKNMVFDYIYADMKQHINEDFQTPKQNFDSQWSKQAATESQIEAVQNWVSTRPELAEELSGDIETISKQEASDKLSDWKRRFIDKFGF